MLGFFAKALSLEDCVILAPHPDDETFGCGEMIAAVVQAGRRVEVVILSDGACSHEGCCEMDKEVLREAREKDAIAALGILGVPSDRIHFLRYHDGSLKQEIATQKKEILALLESFVIKTVFVPHPREGWSDHEAVSQLGDELKAMGWQCFYYCVWFYFSMPFRKFGKVSWRNARCLKDSKAFDRKMCAARAYLQDYAPCGNPYAGVLPKLLQKAVLLKKEVYFKA